MDRRTAERLLDSAAAGRPVGPEPLVRLVRAATLPGRPDELTGEDRAVTAFRGARVAPVRRRTVKSSLAKLVTVKIAALAGALTIGGVALAAGTGALPNLPYVGPASRTPSVHPTGTPPGTDRAHPRSSSPALVGLCHAWLASIADNPGKAADNPAFGALIAAAGGRDQVQPYCTDLLATPTPDKDQGRPSETPGNQPTTPDNQSSKRPGRDPSKHPDKAQTQAPGNQPTATPTSP